MRGGKGSRTAPGRFRFRLIALLIILLLISFALAAKRCPQCGRTYSDDDVYCAECEDENGNPVRLRTVETAPPRPRKVQAAASVRGDTVIVTSTPSSAAVLLDGAYVGNTPITIPAVLSGDHTIIVQYSGYRDDTMKVDVSISLPPGMQFLGRNAQGYEEYLWLKDSSVIIRIPAGSFTMGSPEGEGDDDERPQHKVYLDEYYIDKHEVTNRQYRRFCDATGRRYPPDPRFAGMANYFTAYPDYPVVNVSWDDAYAYSVWVGKQLPTEAEWEKAARGTEAKSYPWGNPGATGQRCNYADRNVSFPWRDASEDDGYAYTSPIGAFPAGASPYGCMNMAGNVWEWCSDWYSDTCYRRSLLNNPRGPAYGSYRVVRGGSWDNYTGHLRATFRHRQVPLFRSSNLGFRCRLRL